MLTCCHHELLYHLNAIESKVFVESLRFVEQYFHDKTDRCYCTQCYTPKQPDTITGVDGGKYVIPRGWSRYGLEVPKGKVAELDIFNKWRVSYHGTSKPALVVSSILREGRFVLPGQELMDGTVLESGKCAGRQVGHTVHTVYQAYTPYVQTGR